MGVINPKEYQTRKLFLVHRNIPKYAIPRMDNVYGKHGSNIVIRSTENQGNLTALEGAP